MSLFLNHNFCNETPPTHNNRSRAGCGLKEGNELNIEDAVRSANLDAVRKAIDDGVDVNTKYHDGWTGLHWASYLGDKEIVEMLIAKNADINAKCNDCLLYTSPSPRDLSTSRMPSSA